jgi:hypothetical protein
VFNAGSIVYQNIDLEPGWNWISFNVDAPAMVNLNNLLADMTWNSTDYFKSEADNLSANYSAQNQHWVTQNAITLNNSYMYKLTSGVEQALQISGTKIKPSDLELPIAGERWNYIGYLPQVRLKIDEALAGYDAVEEDVIKSQDEFAMYAGNIGWVGSLTYLEPGKGYMIFRTQSDESKLIYPDTNGSLNSKSAGIEAFPEFVSHDYSGNMNLVAITDMEPQPGDRILVHSGNEVNAEISSRWINLQSLYFITVPGEAGQPVWFELERNGSVIGQTTKVLPFEANSVKGTLNQPYLLQFAQAGDLLTAYPNPVTNEVTLLLFTEKTGPVDIRISDISGRTVYLGQGETVVAGQSRTLVDCSGLTPGLYFVSVSGDGISQVIKIEKH